MQINNYFYVIDKLYEILLNNEDLAIQFHNKWGVSVADFKRKITDPETHGGYISKMISLENMGVSSGMTVVDIGPEMGLEVFMLSEFAGKIIVCDPDVENLSLIKKIAVLYRNREGRCVSEFIEFVPAGFNNNLFSVELEKNRYRMIKERLGHSLPSFYNVTSTESIADIHCESVDLVFIHKILTTITRNNIDKSFEIFENAIRDLLLIVGEGACSWTEPDFVIEQKEIMRNLKNIDGVDFEIREYYPDSLPEKFIQLIIRKNN